MDTIQKAKAMASSHGTLLAKARRDRKIPMPTMSLSSGIQRGTLRTGTRGNTHTADDYQHYAEQQPVQHIGLFGVSSGSGPLPINNVVCNENKKIQLNAQSPRHLRDFWA
eukprot:2559780-Amphidinium_carterae.1